jgi:hypothetical protein
MAVNGYYYDLNTDQVFVARVRDLPPIAVPGAPTDAKPTGARAFVFACNDCNDPKDRYIGWIEVYTPEAISKLIGAAREPAATQPSSTQPMLMLSMSEMEVGHLIGKPDPSDPHWKDKLVGFVSDEGNAILQASQSRCGPGVIPRNCMPPQPQWTGRSRSWGRAWGMNHWLGITALVGAVTAGAVWWWRRVKEKRAIAQSAGDESDKRAD